ncbi:MAG: amino acid ABC transporter permease [Bacillota bacterium]
MTDFRWELVGRYLPFLLEGAALTVVVTMASIALGIILGLFAGLARISSRTALRVLAGAYIDFFRGTPLLVQIFLIHYALVPMVYGRAASPYLSGIGALSINAGAYIAEIVRAGIQSIDRGQMEAARSLGMTYAQAMRFIILPQAFRRIVPPLGNEFIMLLKDSSLLFAIAVEELMTRGRLMNGRTYRPFEAYLTVAVIYLVMTLTFSRLLGRLERRLVPGDKS